MAQCKQKGFAPVLFLVGILVIIGVAAGVYFFGKSQVPKSQLPNPVVTSPTPQATLDETVNWKTYTNTKYGFSFKYPATWVLSAGNTRIDLQSGSSSLTFYFNNDPDTKVSNSPQSTNNETINIGTELAIFNHYETTVTRQPAAYSDVKSLTIGKYITRVNFYLDPKTDKHDLSTIKQILSTFKFTQ